MATSLEDLRVLKAAEEIADAIWKKVVRWDPFAKDVVGKQLAEASDSIGANVAESFGRFNFGEKIQFLYYARGSLFETKYWLNRSLARELMSADEVRNHATQLTAVARQINSFAASLRTQRSPLKNKVLKESSVEYSVSNSLEEFPESLFTGLELDWLETSLDNLQSLLSTLKKEQL
jgi:four helix bundle protein